MGRTEKEHEGKMTMVKSWSSFAALVATGLALGVAPAAFADQNMYLNELQGKLFVSLTANQATQLGNAACGAIRSGINAGMSMGSARHQGDLAVAAAANQLGISKAAEHNLC